MKLKYLLLACFSGFVFGQNTYQTPYEKGNGNQSVTYDEMNAFYRDLSKNFKSIQYLQKGEDDNGKPIYVVIFNPFKEKTEKLGKDKTILMINNGIHPGEPDGIDATMMLMRDLATRKIKAPENIVIAAIAAYNVSGMLNRGSYSRANQNGPEEYGFRGNTRNYDLNRDFIKADTKNARSFQQIYQWLNPDVFIDNHVSNGADYQYTFTYISTHKERLGTTLGDYFFNNFQAENLKQMETLGYESTPYVNIHGDVPEIGFAAFEDSPRYATGYTSLFNSIGTVVETHMLKPYDKRVDATYKYMLVNLENIDRNYKKIKELRKENLKQYEAGKQYAIRWKVDSTRFSTMDFKGFEAGYKPSAISGQKRLYYDRNKPFTRKIKLFNTYKPTGFVTIPRYYVIPQSEYRVIEELKRNNIRMNILKKDSVASVEAYKINDFKTVKNPYEGHYIHYETVVGKSKKQIKFSAGDYVVPTQQQGVKYIIETLEPEALDSFFNWNFFDAILGQKEYYSAYIFEDTAADLMKNDTALRTAFEAKKKIDKDFAKDGKAQLDWVYQNSPYYEARTYRQYPVYRIL
ncbi:M14 family metallopeptidase [Elizabethkingia meningoseptica]